MFVRRFVLGLLLLFFAERTAHALPKVFFWPTESQGKVYFIPMTDLPMLDVTLIFPVGSARDGMLKGLAYATQRMLREGLVMVDGEHWNGNQLGEALDQLGASLETFNDRDVTVLRLRVLTQMNILRQAATLLVQMAVSPRFDERDIERVKSQWAKELAMQQDRPDILAQRAMNPLLYGKTHPYAHAIMGDAKYIHRIHTEDIRAFHRSWYVREGASVVMVGNMVPSEAHALGRRILASLPRRRGGDTPQAIPALKPMEAAEIKVPFSGTQATWMLAARTPSANDPSWMAFVLANEILGGDATNSRLGSAIRKEAGLVYTIRTLLIPRVFGGVWTLFAQTQVKNIQELQYKVEAVLADTLTRPFTQEEFKKAKAKQRGVFLLQASSHGGFVNALLQFASLGLPADYSETYLKHLDETTLEDVQKAAEALQKTAKVSVWVGGGG